MPTECWMQLRQEFLRSEHLLWVKISIGQSVETGKWMDTTNTTTTTRPIDGVISRVPATMGSI